MKIKDTSKQKWNQIYSTVDESFVQPSYVLAEFQYLLPNTGTALDMACGLGGNAILLAQHGLTTHAWDISEQAIDKLVQASKKNEVKLITSVRDVHKKPPEPNSFDVICVSFFLEREINTNIMSALKPDGLLFYQTFIKERVSDTGPRSLNFRLKSNELLKIFSSLHILVYQELGRVGDIKQGIRDTALLVAQKR